ncbi:hypothetical protein H4CHR_03251 [Variovorax sp. PBS-H4]|uniref:hypothetical protein n=1 Tax=Variovorax sp. PBS-H4 TaxID=434008 RepID=UPI0013173499|nr:hypothetical protein [Variovorax sp. PBS-H4]VTU33620.1 hypothetical protein H4CHR_03251 [Variovorax sp. PBS-H4]
MDVLTYSDLMTGLLSVLGSGILFLSVANWTPKPLREEIARRVEHSITLLDTFEEPRNR